MPADPAQSRELQRSWHRVLLRIVECWWVCWLSRWRLAGSVAG